MSMKAFVAGMHAYTHLETEGWAAPQDCGDTIGQSMMEVTEKEWWDVVVQACAFIYVRLGVSALTWRHRSPVSGH